VVPLSAYDVQRLKDGGVDINTLITLPDGGVTIDADKNGRCPYLKEDNSCSIYAFRPETCFTFPIQKGREGEQLNIRLKCQPALELIRKVITDTVKDGGKLLLPDLTVIQIGG
jgi:Fe-S-cluster containining protein